MKAPSSNKGYTAWTCQTLGSYWWPSRDRHSSGSCDDCDDCRSHLFGAWKSFRWVKDGWKSQQGLNSPIFWVPLLSTLSGYHCWLARYRAYYDLMFQMNTGMAWSSDWAQSRWVRGNLDCGQLWTAIQVVRFAATTLCCVMVGYRGRVTSGLATI